MSEEPVEIPESPESMTPEQAWKLGWEMAKWKIMWKVKQKKDYWKQRATSPESEKRYVEGVVQAVKTKRRVKGIEEVSPDDWAEDVIKGVAKAELTDKEAKKWASKSAPYRELVKWASQQLKAKGYTGVKAAQIWAQEVLPRLAKCRGAPDKIPQVRAELERFFARLPPLKFKPENVEVVIKTG